MLILKEVYIFLCCVWFSQAGLVLSVGMFVVAYFIVGLTALSISAIATNGTVKEGGAYCILQQP